MKILRTVSRRRHSKAFSSEMRNTVQRFLDRAPLEESSVIFDAPGLGCSTAATVLAMLGPERVSQLKSLHFVSASGYAAFFYFAAVSGQFLAPKEISRFNQKNQQRHGIHFPALGLFRVGWRAFKKDFPLFSNDLAEAAVTNSCSKTFCQREMRSFPKNLHFWTYDETIKEMVSINADSEFSDWTPGEVMRTMVAIPNVYGSYEKGGHRYSDAAFAPGIRELYQKLRAETGNCLFLHMRRTGEKGSTLFLKAHDSNADGKTRLLLDFLYFFGGLPNSEFTEGMRSAFSEISPL